MVGLTLYPTPDVPSNVDLSCSGLLIDDGTCRYGLHLEHLTSIRIPQ